MPTLPLPPSASVGGGDLVVATSADVLAVLPAFVTESDSAPVRDGIAAGIREMLLEAQRRGEYASAQSTVLRATGIYLDGLGEDRDTPREQNELDPNYRARILLTPDLVTPNAILAAANAILAPFSAIQARYYEEIDQWYVHDATGAWDCFVYDKAGPYRTPTYPDRLYVDDAAANDGFTVPGRRPRGAVVFDDEHGRLFWLLVPDVSPIDVNEAYVSAAALDANGNLTPDGFYCGIGTETVDFSYVQDSALTEFDLYNAIASAVYRMKGHSIRFGIYVDPLLAA